MTIPALWLATAAMLPLTIAMSWWDLKYLRIPNWIVGCVLGVFVITGLWGLPLDAFAWRLLAGVIVLILGFVLFQFGGIGGGDAKMAAALAPFIALADISLVLIIYAVTTLVLLMGLRLAQHIVRHRETGWEALDQQSKPARKRHFPMGLIFGITIMSYLGLQTAALI